MPHGMRKENFRLTASQRALLLDFASKHSLSMSGAIRLLLARALDENLETAYLDEKIFAMRALLHESTERLVAAWREDFLDLVAKTSDLQKERARPAAPSRGEVDDAAAERLRFLERKDKTPRAPEAPEELEEEEEIEEPVEFEPPAPIEPEEEESEEPEEPEEEEPEEPEEEEEPEAPPALEFEPEQELEFVEPAEQPAAPEQPTAPEEPEEPEEEEVAPKRRQKKPGKPPQERRVGWWLKAEDYFWKSYADALSMGQEPEDARELAIADTEAMLGERGWSWIRPEDGVEVTDWTPPETIGAPGWTSRNLAWRKARGKGEELPQGIVLRGRRLRLR